MDRAGGAYAVLKDFSGTNVDGANPATPLVEGNDGNLYGTTSAGGANSAGGTLFRLSTDGNDYEVLKSFSGTGGEGANPTGLAQGTNGAWYGTTYSGGASDSGTIFEVNGDGTGFSYLHSFTGVGADGANLYSPLIQGGDGAFYGTTVKGGAQSAGTVF